MNGPVLISSPISSAEFVFNFINLLIVYIIINYFVLVRQGCCSHFVFLIADECEMPIFHIAMQRSLIINIQ